MLQFQSLKAKTIFWTALSVFITAGTIVTFSVIALRKQSLEAAKDQLHILAHEESTRFQIEVTKAMDTARTLSQVLLKVRDPNYPLDIPRSEAIDLLRSILQENQYFEGVFTVWEPESYDALDMGYADEMGHDESGRFAPLWSRDDSGELQLQSLLKQPRYNPNGQLGPWYTVPKKTGQQHIASPSILINSPENKVIITVTTPVKQHTTFSGVTGVDFNIQTIQNSLNKRKEYVGKMKLTLISNYVYFAAYSDNPDMAGTFIDKEFENHGDIFKAIQNGNDYNRIFEGYLQTFVPIYIGDTASPWSLNVTVPLSQVTKEVTNLMWQQLFIFFGIMLIMILLAFISARNLTKPLSLLLEGVRRVGGGDLSHPVIVDSKDEIGTFAEVFNDMRVNLQKTLNVLQQHQKGLEEKVADRTRELQKKNEEINSRREKLKTALNQISKLFIQVTREGKFGSYYTHPDLQACWEFKQCNEPDCPCYGQEAMHCWQVERVQCPNRNLEGFTGKYGACVQCDYYKQSTDDPIFQIGEQFNNMMFVLEKNRKELDNAYQQLKESQATILQQEKMASIGQLAAGVAHEINNPIGFVRSNINTLHKDLTKLTDFIQTQGDLVKSCCNDEQLEELTAHQKKLKVKYVMDDASELIEESIDGIERVKTIVQNLKGFSRVDQAEHKNVDINECIEDTLNIIWNELKYKTTVHKEYGDCPSTWCYPQQLNQVFMNLLVNAAQAIEEKGDITITSYRQDENIIVKISDTGKGIPEENIKKLFEPFFTTKEVGKGTGLGLSIVYDIITKKHKGNIEVESEVGKGTTFTITLPILATKELLLAE